MKINRNVYQHMGEASSEVEKCQHLQFLVCSRAIAEHHLRAAEALGDLLLMLRPVLQNLVQPAPGLPQVQLQGVQDGLLVLLQDAAHALEILLNPLLHHLRHPLSEKERRVRSCPVVILEELERSQCDTHGLVCLALLQRLDVSLSLGPLRLQLLQASGQLLLGNAPQICFYNGWNNGLSFRDITSKILFGMSWNYKLICFEFS